MPKTWTGYRRHAVGHYGALIVSVVLNFSPWAQTVERTFPEDGGWTDLLSGWQAPVHDNRLRCEVGSNWGHIFH